MKDYRIQRLFPALVAAAFFAAPGTAAGQEIEAGKLHERVASQGDPSQGFADVQALESSKPLESLRGTPEFRRLLESLKGRPGRAPDGGR